MLSVAGMQWAVPANLNLRYRGDSFVTWSCKRHEWRSLAAADVNLIATVASHNNSVRWESSLQSTELMARFRSLVEEGFLIPAGGAQSYQSENWLLAPLTPSTHLTTRIPLQKVLRPSTALSLRFFGRRIAAFAPIAVMTRANRVSRSDLGPNAREGEYVELSCRAVEALVEFTGGAQLAHVLARGEWRSHLTLLETLFQQQFLVDENGLESPPPPILPRPKTASPISASARPLTKNSGVLGPVAANDYLFGALLTILFFGMFVPLGYIRRVLLTLRRSNGSSWEAYVMPDNASYADYSKQPQVQACERVFAARGERWKKYIALLLSVSSLAKKSSSSKKELSPTLYPHI